MVALARREAARVPGGPERARFHVADVRTDPLPASGYDVIVTNFLLDCFPVDQLGRVVLRLSEAAAPNARWVVGDFAEPPAGWRRALARVALAGMYAFFRLTTHIPAAALVDPGPMLAAAGFVPVSRRQRLGGFLVSTLWQRTAKG
jgi:hypothetical protein